MSYYDKPILLMFLGYPGSGKTYFARAVADRLEAVRLNSDAMRMSIFGSRAETDRIYASGNRKILNSYVFNAMNYVADQILSRGHDLVYDANHNRRADRAGLEQIANKNNATPILVWIQTPIDVALHRGQTREETQDQRKFTEDKIKEVVEQHAAATDKPASDELVIIIDGQVPFEQQFAAFETQLAQILQPAARKGVHNEHR